MLVAEALNRALHQAMREHGDVYFLGEDILDPYGGAFKLAAGLSSEYPDRVLTTPVSEGGVVGLATGMAMRGFRPVVEIMFGDFITLAADQIINHAAKMRWMSNNHSSVPLVVRTPMGGRRGYGPTHSQTLEKHFLGVPGLRVVALSDMDNPGGLLETAILEDDDPVLFIENKHLYTQEVLSLSDLSEYSARRSQSRYPTLILSIQGAPPPSLTVTAYGATAQLVRQAALELAYEHEIFTELIVPSEISPYNIGDILESVSRSGALLTVEEGPLTAGWGAEIIARVAETAAAPLQFRRVAALDSPIPASAPLESAVLPGVETIVHAARTMRVPG